MRLKIFFLALCSLFLTPVWAQSNLTYDLRIGATGPVELLETFPESYHGEKVNITLADDSYITLGTLETLDPLQRMDFFFADEYVPALSKWGDSIYSYTDETDIQWTVWQNKKEIKNRGQRVLVGNAYKVFTAYVQEHTSAARRSRGWIWWVLAALALVLALTAGGVQIVQRRKEKNLSSVEQEMLRRQRMGMRRHYGSQLYLWLLLIVLYAPIALIAVFSFTKSKILGNWTGFSMDLYVNLFTGKADAGLNSAIWYTVVIALIAAVVSTILGTLAAIGI